MRPEGGSRRGVKGGAEPAGRVSGSAEPKPRGRDAVGPQTREAWQGSAREGAFPFPFLPRGPWQIQSHAACTLSGRRGERRARHGASAPVFMLFHSAHRHPGAPGGVSGTGLGVLGPCPQAVTSRWEAERAVKGPPQRVKHPKCRWNEAGFTGKVGVHSQGGAPRLSGGGLV